jgi:SARP family transcriptional regulator, regulator of embCAB operon
MEGANDYLQIYAGADPNFFITILGGFGLFWGNNLIGVPRASQRLLVYLALRGRMVQRAVVAGTLWPDVPESHAYSNLRSTISRLHSRARKVLETGKLELGLAQPVTVDFRHAQVLACRLLEPEVTLGEFDPAMTAIAALSADLLPGWCDEWVVIEAEEWRQIRLHALEALAGRLIAAGRWGEAASAASAAVRAEPLRESARATLIQLHLAEGNQSEVVREYTRYKTLLQAELGLEPSSRLRYMVEGLKSS